MQQERPDEPQRPPESSVAPGPWRVLVTGSREWTDTVSLKDVLNALASQHGKHVVLVSGACPTGADRLTEQYATWLGWTVELHPADWGRHGKRAGFVRNADMVALGADLCIAFIRNGSKGASMTADLAAKAGIPVLRATGGTGAA